MEEKKDAIKKQLQKRKFWKISDALLRVMSWVTAQAVIRCCKRVFDIIFVLFLCIVFFPLIVIIVIAIEMEDVGPFLWKEKKVGRFGECYNLFSFRIYSMDFIREEKNGRGQQDMTVIGRKLFSGHLDRIPVLFNILRGEMSFVGPYPSSSEEADEYCYKDREIFNVKPGIANSWFIRKSSNIAYGGKMAIDLEYAQTNSFLGDVGILFRSIISIFFSLGGTFFSEDIDIFDISIDNLTQREVLNKFEEIIDSRSSGFVCFVNPDCLNIAWRDEAYRNIIKSCDIVLPDGIGIHVACKMLGTLMKENVNGTDLFPDLCERAVEKSLSLYLFGAKEGIAQKAAENMKKKYPGLTIKGARHGYCSEQETDKVIEEISALDVDILLVAMGAPMQEKWLFKYKDKLNVRLMMGVGGLFDFYSGQIARAPVWMREIGLEWMYRLLQEPKRMWRRYIIGNPLFLFRVFLWGRSKKKEKNSETERSENN